MQIIGEHLDLLLSKLFHDLISPVSAARNGLELVREFGGDDVGADALDLVAQSVDQANDRLTFFRMAFGGAGSSGSLAMHNVPDLAAGYLKSRKISADASNWTPGETRVGGAKVVLGGVAVAADFLPRGGQIVLSADQGSAEIKAEGTGAAFSAPLFQALMQKVEPSTETVFATTVADNASRFNVRIDAEQVAPAIRFSWS